MRVTPDVINFVGRSFITIEFFVSTLGICIDGNVRGLQHQLLSVNNFHVSTETISFWIKWAPVAITSLWTFFFHIIFSIRKNFLERNNQTFVTASFTTNFFIVISKTVTMNMWRVIWLYCMYISCNFTLLTRFNDFPRT